ncbi:MAG: hypothetical protein WBW33_02335 [Bryobacteraceae bacterium]
MRPRHFGSRLPLLCFAVPLFAISVAAGSPSDAPAGMKDPSTPPPPGASEVPAQLMAASARPSSASLPAPRLSGYDLLLRGREASSRIYRELSSVVCRERIDRFKGPVADAVGHPVDVVTSDVAMEEGVERYSNIRQNDKPRPGISRIGGAWSEGEYSTFLRQTAEILDSDNVIKMGVVTRFNGTPAILFPFDVSQSDSNWDFLVRSKHYLLGFHGEVWISQATGEVLRIRRTANQVPSGAGISQVDWSVDFGPSDLDGHSFILPSKATYSVTYPRDQHREWNVISFSNYHHYGVEVTIHYN